MYMVLGMGSSVAVGGAKANKKSGLSAIFLWADVATVVSAAIFADVERILYFYRDCPARI